jgi:acyl-CoA dehydrogenase
VHQIGSAIVAPAADAVDRDARFPREAIEALRAERLLGALIPIELGGLGLDFPLVAAICEALGQYCASAAMVYAMHQIQVSCVVRHSEASPFWRQYLQDLAAREGLIASATSEVGVGGDVRSSVCAVERDGNRFTLAKQAPVISYGEHADEYLITARRTPESPPNDQVLVLARRDETTLERTGGWDTLGFRGTCSLGFRLRATGDAGQILPTPFADISSQTMLPVSHILWSSLWTGIAVSAVRRARAFVRRDARKSAGTVPASALRAAELVSALQTMRSNVHDCARDYAAIMDDVDSLGTLRFAIRMNNLKVAASMAVVDIVGQALLICGMSGYKTDSPYSLGRHLRDAYGAMLMINNDRITAANASMLLVSKDE